MLKKLQSALEEWLEKTNDPILECFRKRDDFEFVEAYIQKLEEEANARRIKDKPTSKLKKEKKKS